MIYHFNDKKFFAHERQELLNEISLFKGEGISPAKMNELIAIMEKTSDMGVINSIAVILSMTGRPVVVSHLIKKIALSDVTETSTLLYACSEFDCSPHLLFFAEQFVKDGFNSQMSAFSILEEMKSPVIASQKRAALDIIQQCLQEKQLNADTISFYYALLDTIQPMPEYLH